MKDPHEDNPPSHSMPELTGRFGNFVFAAKGLSAVLVVALGLRLITLGGAVVWAFG